MYVLHGVLVRHRAVARRNNAELLQIYLLQNVTLNPTYSLLIVIVTEGRVGNKFTES